jgi:hypothetical protein
VKLESKQAVDAKLNALLVNSRDAKQASLVRTANLINKQRAVTSRTVFYAAFTLLITDVTEVLLSHLLYDLSAISKQADA